MNLLDSFRAARRVGTPLIAINCFDPEATMASIQAMIKEIEDDKNLEDKDRSTIIQWDVIRGWVGRDNKSEAVIEAFLQAHDIERFATEDPVENIVKSLGLPPKSVLFLIGAQNYFEQPPFIQAVWNLRDEFKVSKRVLVMLGTSIVLPEALRQDVLVLDEPLPTDKDLRQIISITSRAAEVDIDDECLDKAVDALRGLPSFPAEQATAMCLSPEGLDTDLLWERKRSTIAQTPGLSVFKDGLGFDHLGGLDEIKARFRRIIAGRAKPKVIVFMDELEKAMAGVNTDSSGTAQDQVGVVLSEMTDKQYSGALLIGPPGAAKSAFSKAVGIEAGILTIKMDLGAMKGNGLVGQAEKEIRHAMKVIEAVGGIGGAFFIATSNDIRVIKPELKRRFKKGIWYFDLPTKEERQAIWKIFCSKYDMKYSPSKITFDENWTGAEIESCVSTAWEEDISIEEAAKGIIPVAVSAKADLDRLRQEANGRYNSVSYPGPYISKLSLPSFPIEGGYGNTSARQKTDQTPSERSIVFED